jgi:hypothetical protein
MRLCSSSEEDIPWGKTLADAFCLNLNSNNENNNNWKDQEREPEMIVQQPRQLEIPKQSPRG